MLSNVLVGVSGQNSKAGPQSRSVSQHLATSTTVLVKLIKSGFALPMSPAPRTIPRRLVPGAAPSNTGDLEHVSFDEQRDLASRYYGAAIRTTSP